MFRRGGGIAGVAFTSCTAPSSKIPHIILVMEKRGGEFIVAASFMRAGNTNEYKIVISRVMTSKKMHVIGRLV
jgi:hypothetical protein